LTSSGCPPQQAMPVALGRQRELSGFLLHLTRSVPARETLPPFSFRGDTFPRRLCYMNGGVHSFHPPSAFDCFNSTCNSLVFHGSPGRCSCPPGFDPTQETNSSSPATFTPTAQQAPSFPPLPPPWRFTAVRVFFVFFFWTAGPAKFPPRTILLFCAVPLPRRAV